MTAILIAKQRSYGLAHVLNDAALYRQDQTVAAFGTKVATIPHWPGLLTTAGSAAASPLFARALSQQFLTWDDLVRAGNDEIGKLAEIVTEWGLGHATVTLVGFSAERRQPESFVFMTDDTLPPGTTRAEAEASPYYAAPYRLIELPDHVMTPTPPAEDIIAANFEGFHLDEDPEICIWSMRKALTIARHMSLPSGLGSIGGWAALTSISATGITQRVVERWPQDTVGAPLHHGPIDWDQWHADNPKPGMSRLKREMAARKASRLRVIK